MNKFHLEPADILVNLIVGNDPYSVVKRCTLGSPYSHVFMYLGRVGLYVNRWQRRILRIPLLFESIGRGVLLRSLSERYGEEVVVLRLKSEHDRRRIGRVLEEAVKLASDERSHYDYLCIVRFVLPRLICEKLGLPLALKWHRDPLQICSEAVNEVYHQAGVDLLPQNVVPLPGDFATSSLLHKVWSGILEVDNAF